MKDILQKVKSDESGYEAALEHVASEVCGNIQIRLVLIAGGSCAGKTTTTKKLSQLISQKGRVCHTISLDDFYRNPEDSVYLPDGTRDIETVRSLETGMIRDVLKRIAACEPTPVPYFDFKTKRRTDSYRVIDAGVRDVVIVEGLHALNPELYDSDFDLSVCYRVFLYADAGDGSDCRFVRRLVRDSRHRSSDCEMLYCLWENVKKNELESIDPYSGSADIRINTFFPYERGILDDDAIRLLDALPDGSEFKHRAVELRSKLGKCIQYPDSVIPENSLLHEFI